MVKNPPATAGDTETLVQSLGREDPLEGGRHYKNMKRINDLAIEKGIRDKIIICAGGTQVIPEEAVKTGIDMGFGRNSHGIDVATFLAQERQRRRGEVPHGFRPEDLNPEED